MSGVELLVAQLVLNGIAKVAMNKLNGSAAIAKSVSATEREVMRMSGVVHGLLSETGGLRDALSSLICSVSLQRASNRRDRMLAAIPDASPLLRSKALQVATMVAAVLEETAVETVGVEVSRVVVDEDDDEYFTKTNKVHFSRVHSDAEIVAAVLALEAADQVFTGLRHETQDRMRLFVNAWAPSEKDLNRLAEATGALYQLCQTLCDVIADSRGVFATSVGDGNISKSYTKLTHNSSTILLNYDWPTPTQLDDFGEIVKKARDGEKEATSQLQDAIELKAMRQRTKNVYLIGQTGEGKSTLANNFTGTDNFHVSYAGTGTYDVSGCLVQRAGALDMEEQVMVWDTPGMNDQDGLDEMFVNKLYAHLTREQTVSTILIVTKDGSRFPRTLKEMIAVYRKAFGESFLSCVAVCIGVNMETARPEEIRQKRVFWKQKMKAAIGQKIPPDRIFFYNAQGPGTQAELGRLRRAVLDAKIYLSGSGNTIYQGLLQLRTEKNQLAKTETKERMRKASEEIIQSLVDEILCNPRIRFRYKHGDNSVNVKLLHTIRSAMTTFFRFRGFGKNAGSNGQSSGDPIADEAGPNGGGNGGGEKRRKEIRFCQGGSRALDVMKSVGYPMTGVADRDRFHVMMKRAERHGLVLTKMESETEGEVSARVQVQNYMLVDIDDELDGEIYRRIEEILQGLVTDRHVAEPIMRVLESLKSGVGSSSVSSSSIGAPAREASP